MSMVQQQHLFLHDVVRLLQFAWNKGYILTGGELFRTVEQQKIYLDTGRSKTMNSLHLKRCAIDLNIFKDGKLCTHEQIIPLGKYWEELDPINRWGGNFDKDHAKADRFIDSGHFERTVQ